jgi:threonine/homoserine/homoserine lactone efflux protein
VTNPKIVVFYATVVPGFLHRGATVLPWTLAAAAIHATMGLAWLAVWAHAFARARGLLERRRARAWIDRAGGAVLVALGVRLALERR